MATGRSLIVNADDFGQSPGINAGIIQSFEQGIVTSASLMVRWPAAEAAAAYAREHPELSVGLHADLCEWSYLDGEWTPVYTVVAEDDAGAVAEELSRQLAQFRALLGRNPTHLDSHQHVHRGEPALSVFLEASRTLGIPLRHYSGIFYCGEFYGQTATGLPYPEGLSAQTLLQIFLDLPTGVTELGCHPGLRNDVRSMYRGERIEEVKILCEPTIRDHLEKLGIALRSFHNFDGQTATSKLPD